jgi:hypothetical protein
MFVSVRIERVTEKERERGGGDEDRRAEERRG